MKRMFLVFNIIFNLMIFNSHDARAECRGGAVSGTPACTPDTYSGGGSGIYVPPPVDPVYEALQKNNKIFQERLGALFENTATAGGFLNMPAPGSEQELSRRIDDLFAAVWPEYRANFQKADLYRRQVAFYGKENEAVRKDVARMNADIIAMRTNNPALKKKADETEASLAGAQEQERLLRHVGLSQLNRTPTEDHIAAAYLMVFTPEIELNAKRLDTYIQHTALPGTQPPPVFYPSASLAPPYASALPPREMSELNESPPVADAVLQDKLTALQSLSSNMQKDFFDLSLREKSELLAKEYSALKSEEEIASSSIKPLLEEKIKLEERLNQAQQSLSVSDQNSRNAARIIVTELVADLALDQLADEMKEVVDGIAGAEGLSEKIPEDGHDGILKFAKEGGKLLLPHKGYEKQWEAFVEMQKQTLDVLDRAEGFMLEAANLAARSSPEEMEEMVDRVFGSVGWQSVEYVRVTGVSSFSADDGNLSFVEKALEKFIEGNQKQQSATE